MKIGVIKKSVCVQVRGSVLCSVLFCSLVTIREHFVSFSPSLSLSLSLSLTSFHPLFAFCAFDFVLAVHDKDDDEEAEAEEKAKTKIKAKNFSQKNTMRKAGRR